MNEVRTVPKKERVIALKQIEVLAVEVLEGEGDGRDDPWRRVIEIWTPKGKKIARIEPVKYQDFEDSIFKAD